MREPKPGDRLVAWLAGLLCIAAGTFELMIGPIFVASGVSAKARVLEVTLHRSPRGREYHTPRYELISHPDAATCKDDRGFWRWTAPKIGDIVDVLYVQESGSIYCTKDSMLHRWGFPAFFIGFGIALLINKRLVQR